MRQVIADRVDLTGTLRTFSDRVHCLVVSRLEALCAGVSASFGVRATLTVQRGYPATVNRSADAVDVVARAAARVVGASGVREPRSSCCAEDFAYFLQAQPNGAFFFVGSAPTPIPDTEENQQPRAEAPAADGAASDAAASTPSASAVIPHHCNTFDIDERALGVGVSVFINIVESMIGTQQTQKINSSGDK
jgi:metal-dependent amidase/aminoacylase/carboxypeptidase family protein